MHIEKQNDVTKCGRFGTILYIFERICMIVNLSIFFKLSDLCGSKRDTFRTSGAFPADFKD